MTQMIQVKEINWAVVHTPKALLAINKDTPPIAYVGRKWMRIGIDGRIVDSVLEINVDGHWYNA